MTMDFPISDELYEKPRKEIYRRRVVPAEQDYKQRADGLKENWSDMIFLSELW